MYPPSDLQEFLSQLESANELVRVRCEVDPYLETATIIDKVCKTSGGGKALLFENIKGSSIPLAANLFGSMKRMALSLGVQEIGLMQKRIEQELSGYKGVASEEALRQLVIMSAETIPSAPDIQLDNQRTVCRLSDLPILHSWPGDGGKYLTLSQTFTALPSTGQQNCGMYRVQIVDEQRALLRCHPGSGGVQHMKAWHENGEPMPVAIVLGGPPALTWAAGVSLPVEIGEVDFVSWLTGSPVLMSCCVTSDLKVPQNAEILIEGVINPGEELLEGPFGNHTGIYTDSLPAPVINIATVSVRKNGVYPCTVVGPPPMENVCLAKTTERLFLKLLQHDCPWVENVHFPVETIYHRIAFVQVTSDCDLSLQQIEERLTGSLLLGRSKKIVLLDALVNLESLEEVFWNIVNKSSKSVSTGSCLMDARTLEGQESVCQDERVVEFVSNRWRTYQI